MCPTPLWRWKTPWTWMSSLRGGRTGFAKKTPTCGGRSRNRGIPPGLRSSVDGNPSAACTSNEEWAALPKIVPQRVVLVSREGRALLFEVRMNCPIKRIYLPATLAAALLAFAAIFGGAARADRPYAPSRDYHLQNVRVSLRFDLDQRKVLGDVTHTLAALHDGLKHLDFDCADLTVSS